MMFFKSLSWWIQGFVDSAKIILGLERLPPGQSGGLLSPLLETLRANHAAHWVKGPKILDCGCGRARLLRLLRGKAVEYTAVEQDPTLIHFLEKRHPDARFIQSSLEALEIKHAEKFDSIVLLAVLEHLAEPEPIVQKLVSCLNPGGVLIASTPSPIASGFLHVAAKFSLVSGHAYEDHKDLLSRVALEELLTAAGLLVERYYKFIFFGNQLIVGRRPS